jgi:succinyl-diaminopimelate desuccinylase
MDTRRVDEWLQAREDEMVQLQAELTSRRAIGPENDGAGEWQKARYLEDYLRDHGMPDAEHFDCPDSRVPEGSRPNFVVTMRGARSKPRIWVLTHLDVVPPGNRRADGTWEGWETDPFELRRTGDVIVGRGVADNQQSITSSVFAARALVANQIQPVHTLKLLFVSDEEVGSGYGLEYLLKEHRDLFAREDAIIVPDGGNEDGSMIEIAEKSVLWLEFRVRGKQSHASRPDRGINAFRAASRLVCLLDEGLPELFGRQDHLFEPPRSTFEPTLHAANVPNVNTIPGEDVFCFDCRILPDNDLDDVLDYIRMQCRHLDGMFGTSTDIVERNRLDAPTKTRPDAPVVRLLEPAVREVLGVEPQTMGIGGMTVASFFRRSGLPAAVWSTSPGTAHQVNETCPVANMVNDARVFARVFGSEF